MGARPKIEEVGPMIVKYVAQGNTNKDSAVLAGVDEKTFYNWKNKGLKAKSGAFLQFVQDLKEAEKKFKAVHLQNINKTAVGGYDVVEETEEWDSVLKKMVVTKRVKKRKDTTWQASAWLLERKYQSEFGKRHIELDIDVKKPLPLFADPELDAKETDPLKDANN